MRITVISLSTLKKIETFPRPLGIYHKYIKHSDIVEDYGHFKCVKARPEHIPLLIDSFKDFLRTETICAHLGLTEPSDEIVFGFLANVTRYPFSYFGLNNQNEIVSFGLQDIVYKDNTKDPRPRFELPISNPKDPFNAIAPILDYGEHRLFEILKTDKYLHSEAAYTPSSLRGKKYSSTLCKTIARLSFSEAVDMGFKHSVGIVTGEANLRNMMKLKFTMLGRIPKEMYKDMDGKRFSIPGEETAMLICSDMEQMVKDKVFV